MKSAARHQPGLWATPCSFRLRVIQTSQPFQKVCRQNLYISSTPHLYRFSNLHSRDLHTRVCIWLPTVSALAVPLQQGRKLDGFLFSRYLISSGLLRAFENIAWARARGFSRGLSRFVLARSPLTQTFALSQSSLYNFRISIDHHHQACVMLEPLGHGP